MLEVELFIEHLQAELNLSAHTVRAYQTDVCQFIRFLTLRKKDLAKVNPSLLRDYLNYLRKKNLSRRSMARKLSSLRHFFTYLRQTNYLSNNTNWQTSSPKLNRYLPTTMSASQVKTLISAPDTSSPYGLRDLAILELLYATGIRVSELVSLNLSDLDFAQKQVKVFGKGRKQRIVPMNNYAIAAIKNYLSLARKILLKNGKHNPALFINRDGMRLSAQGVRKLLIKYCHQVKLPKKVTPHVFRHTFATHLLEADAELRAVQELLGHVDLSSTQIYTHLSKPKLKQIYKQAHPRA